MEAQKKEPQVQISFRLPPSFAARLEELGQEVGLGKHAYARLLVIESVANTWEARLRDEVVQVKDQVARLREDMLISVANLFVHAGKLSAREAEEWVNNNMT